VNVHVLGLKIRCSRVPICAHARMAASTCTVWKTTKQGQGAKRLRWCLAAAAAAAALPAL
jgi:hypothetical protein